MLTTTRQTRTKGRVGSGWIPKDGSAYVAGREIGGMIYVGRGPRTGSFNVPDNAFIDPNKSVASRGGDYEGQGMDYWPNYSAIDARSRATYLDWLSGDRSDTRYGVGYVFLYFYGLERRVFIDKTESQERDDIVAEVRRLLDVYGDNHSIRRYLGAFLDTTSLMDSSGEPQPVFEHDGYEVPAYLAERSSRSQPKEATLDYTTDGEWRDPREPERRQDPRPGDGRGEAAEAPRAANDNAVVRIAQEIRHAVNGWRHGAAVDAFAAERQEVMASWDDLRARAREEGEAVAVSPAFRETLDRNGALLKQAASFRARPKAFERILVERAGIGGREIEELREQHARAGRYMRSVRTKVSQVARQDARPAEAGLVEAIVPGTSAPAGDPAPEDRTVPDRPSEERQRGLPASEHSEAAYRLLRRDWRRHVGRAERSGISPFELDGAAELIRRIGEFAGRGGLPVEPRRQLQDLVDRYNRHVQAGARVEAWLRDADRHWRRYQSIFRRAQAFDVAPETLRPYRDWLQRNERLLRDGRAILDGPATYGVHLDRMEGARQRLRDAVCAA